MKHPTSYAEVPAVNNTQGNPKSHIDNECPQTQVTITQGFFMGKYEVTRAEYFAVMEAAPSYAAKDSTPSYFGKDTTLPVEYVNWEEASAYCAF